MYLQRVLMASVAAATGLFLTACATAPETQEISNSYQCGQLNINVTSLGNGDQLEVDYKGEQLQLERKVSASGARYEASDNEGTLFWSKGEWAMFSVKGQAYPDCLQAGALETPFEATGNEPFWHVQLMHQQLELNRPDDTGEPKKVALETTASNQNGREFRGKLAGQPLTLKVNRQLCEDTMSGAQFPAQVRLELNGEVLEGCGGDPERLFRGVEWVVEDLAGAGIIDSSRMTVEFFDENRLAGRASCNRYGGQYELTAEGMTFDYMFSTKMACAPALMNQEDRFLKLMSNVKRAEIGPNGKLVLTTSSNEEITAYKATY
ncbi:META domain-containing protein [Marinobacter sp. S6332]|uniref:META domain-containing protein n=1 Tax=Marinobacter sp. S6332 TaxID=2926403 RepID=UPI001FF18E03|nr:META domain-containing protein [Marinobacter sp. S6332]MCK0163404.1 META domain-containing protein [Marinobacter sp. S6332]